MSVFITGDDVAFPSDLWEIPVCPILRGPHTHVVLHLEIRIQDSETVVLPVLSGGIKEETSF